MVFNMLLAEFSRCLSKRFLEVTINSSQKKKIWMRTLDVYIDKVVMVKSFGERLLFRARFLSSTLAQVKARVQVYIDRERRAICVWINLPHPRCTWSSKRVSTWRIFFLSLCCDPLLANAESTMWAMALLQVLVSSFACMAVGYVWFSPGVFGQLWWKYQFPGKKFGQCEGSLSPIYTTFVAMLVQNSLLVVVIDSIMEYSRQVSYPFPDLVYPVALAGILSALVACASYPHYAYSLKPFALFCICAGFDTVQLYSSAFVIYFLSWRSSQLPVVLQVEFSTRHWVFCSCAYSICYMLFPHCLFILLLYI